MARVLGNYLHFTDFNRLTVHIEKVLTFLTNHVIFFNALVWGRRGGVVWCFYLPLRKYNLNAHNVHISRIFISIRYSKEF